MSQYKIIIPADIKPKPTPLEQNIAELMAKFAKSDVRFVKRGNTPTPDILIGQIHWEIKHIRGNAKYTIQNNLREASRQSRNVIISLAKTKMTTAKAQSRISYFLQKSPHSFLRVILVTKSSEIMVLKNVPRKSLR
jgi:hypothetical protein